MRRETLTAPALVKDGLRLIPRAKVVTVRLPRLALVWSRPLDVLVGDGGDVRGVQIPDVTRTAQVLLWTCAAAAAIALRLLAIRERRTAS